MTGLAITDIKSYLVSPTSPSGEDWCDDKTYLFVKIETNNGIDGWGESYVLGDRERSTQMHVTEMRRYLIGTDPGMIKNFQYWAYNHYAERRAGIDLSCAISGIEIAMWDIMGKYYNTPIYNLLGGPVHKKLKAYANLASSRFQTPDAVAQRAKEMVKQGFKAVKMYPLDFDESDDVVVERVIKVREAIGEQVELMVDLWRKAEPKRAISIAKRIEPFNIIWFEEPIASDNLDIVAEIKNSINLPIVMGECIWGKRAFNEVLRKNAADIINADISVVGGILELKEIAAMAEANYVKIGPHNYNSTTVSTSASIHAACTMPNFNYMEVFPSFWAIGDKICQNQLEIDDKGYFTIPEGPGLGLCMNEEYMIAHPFRERGARAPVNS